MKNNIIKIINDLLEGLKNPSIIVLRGTIGSGKSLFISTFLNEYFKQSDKKASILLLMVSKNTFFNTAYQYGLIFDNEIKDGILDIEEITALPSSSSERADALMGLFIEKCSSIRGGVLLVYPAEIGFLGLPYNELINIIGTINTCRDKYNVSVLLAFNTGVGDNIRRVFEAVADYVFELNIEIPSIGTPRRFITIVKPLRELIGVSRTAEVDIVKGKGMEITLYGIKYQYEVRTPTRRIYTGINWLDKILGGIMSGTSILITGPSGSGKTTLLLTMSYGLAMNGNNIVYISFEEPVNQLVYTMNTLGYDYERVSDRLRFININPRTITLNSLFRAVMKNISIKHDIIIIDGIHAIWKEFGSEYHKFLRDIVYYVKTIGSTLLLSMVSIKDKESYTLLSTIVDGIIELTLELIGNEYKRKICLRKLRYHKVIPKCYEYTI